MHRVRTHDVLTTGRTTVYGARSTVTGAGLAVGVLGFTQVYAFNRGIAVQTS
jgi:hypothetical protein